MKREERSRRAVLGIGAAALAGLTGCTAGNGVEETLGNREESDPDDATADDDGTGPARVGAAPDTAGNPSHSTARTAPATRTYRLPRTPHLLRIMAAPLVGLDATGLVAAQRASRPGGGWARGVFHRHHSAGSSSYALGRKAAGDPARG